LVRRCCQVMEILVQLLALGAASSPPTDTSSPPTDECSSIDGDGPASDYLELLRRSLVGATALFSTVHLFEGGHHSNPRNAGVMINSGYGRLRNLQCLLQEIVAADVPGDMVETGIWRGGSTIFMGGFVQAYNLSRRAWGFDSFMGIPSVKSGRRDAKHDVAGKPTWDNNETSDLSVPLRLVQSHVDKYALSHRVKLVQGYFEDSIPPLVPLLAVRGISLLRLDGDLYSSTMQVLRLLYPLLHVGGWVVHDDWAVPQSQAAVRDYRAQHGIDEKISFHAGSLTYPVARWRMAAHWFQGGAGA